MADPNLKINENGKAELNYPYQVLGSGEHWKKEYIIPMDKLKVVPFNTFMDSLKHRQTITLREMPDTTDIEKYKYEQPISVVSKPTQVPIQLQMPVVSKPKRGRPKGSINKQKTTVKPKSNILKELRKK